MLAYLLWHWPLPDTDVSAYERSMIDFHRSLAAARSAGFLESTVFRSSGVPWEASGGPSYEDWYMLKGPVAMDVPNDLSVSGGSKIHHNAAAGGVKLRRLDSVLCGSAVLIWPRPGRAPGSLNLGE